MVRFVLLPGQHHDSVGVRPLIEGVAFGALLGDKAFDADWLRAELDDRGAAAVIPPKVNRKTIISFDRDMYRWRHLIENTFAKLKEFRAVATRYDKTRHQLHRHHPPRGCDHRFTLNVNRPSDAPLSQSKVAAKERTPRKDLAVFS